MPFKAPERVLPVEHVGSRLFEPLLGKPWEACSVKLSEDDLALLYAHTETKSPPPERVPHSRWPSSSVRDVNGYLDRLESRVSPPTKAPIVLRSRPKADTIQTRSIRSRQRPKSENRSRSRTKRPVRSAGAQSALDHLDFLAQRTSSSEDTASEAASPDFEATVSLEQKPNLPASHWSTPARQAHLIAKKQTRIDDSLPVRMHEYSDDQKDPDFGVKKGQAKRGRKITPSYMMLFKPRNPVKVIKIKGIRFDLIRARLANYGIQVDHHLIAKAHKVFCQLCHSDSADMNQFDRVMRRLGVPDVYVNDRIFKCFDVDVSGTVDLAEFMLGLTAAWDSPLADKLSTYFKQMDKNSDGMLDHSEVECMLIDSKQWSKPREIKTMVNAIFEAIDPGGRGEISQYDFLEALFHHPEVVVIFDKCFGTKSVHTNLLAFAADVNKKKVKFKDPTKDPEPEEAPSPTAAAKGFGAMMQRRASAMLTAEYHGEKRPLNYKARASEEKKPATADSSVSSTPTEGEL